MPNTQEVVAMPLSQLVADKFNPRQEFDPVELQRLEESVSRQGILNPLLVEPIGDGTYLIDDGERRYRVAKKLELQTVPVRIGPALSPQERLLVRFNLQEVHSPWSMWDKSVAVAELQALTGWNTSELVVNLGISRANVETLLAFQRLSKRTVGAASEAKLPAESVAKIGRAIKNIEPEKAAAIEQAFISGAESGKIYNRRGVNRFIITAKEATMDQFRKFENTKEYVMDDILKENNAQHKTTENSLLINTTSGVSAAKKLIQFLAENPNLQVSHKSVDKAIEAVNVLSRFVEASSGRIEVVPVA